MFKLIPRLKSSLTRREVLLALYAPAVHKCLSNAVKGLLRRGNVPKKFAFVILCFSFIACKNQHQGTVSPSSPLSFEKGPSTFANNKGTVILKPLGDSKREYHAAFYSVTCPDAANPQNKINFTQYMNVRKDVVNNTLSLEAISMSQLGRDQILLPIGAHDFDLNFSARYDGGVTLKVNSLKCLSGLYTLQK